MVESCVVCRKKRVSGDRTVTFHKFPTTNKDLRQKWLRAIGKTCVSKKALVCSDHFEKSSYYDINDLSTIKKLIPTAVPHVFINDQEIINNITITGQKIIDNFIGYKQSFPDSNNITIKEESEQSIPDSNNITIKEESAENQVSFTESISDELIEKHDHILNNIHEHSQDIPELIEKKDFMLNDIHQQPQDIPELIEENALKLNNIHEHPQHILELIEKKKFMLNDIHEQPQDIPQFIEKNEFMLNDSYEQPQDIPELIEENDLVLSNIHEHPQDNPELIEKDDLRLNSIHEHLHSKIGDLPKDDFCTSPSIKSCLDCVSSHDAVQDSSSPNLLVSNYTTTENHKELKRKKASNEEGNFPKKIKLYNRLFTREDFTSEGAWTYFVEGIAIERAQKHSFRTQLRKEQKYKEHLQNQHKNFKECVQKEAASYLEDLPGLVREIVIRIKDGGSTAPFSADLTNFALSLRSHSPAAYDFVRDSFSKSLPCSKTLKRISKKQKLGNSEEIPQIVENESEG